MWGGADPGGANCFGVCRLNPDGSFETHCVSDVVAATAFLKPAAGVGIDCPLWWSLERGGGRRVDALLRRAYGIHPGTVQSVNSLKGAVIAQGMLLAMQLRELSPDIEITETHPKALILARRQSYEDFFDEMGVRGPKPSNEHECDALVGPIVSRQAALGAWTEDLAARRGNLELDPRVMWFGQVKYMWFEQPT
jgi:predicted nuclease with RNAse H fold